MSKLWASTATKLDIDYAIVFVNNFLFEGGRTIVLCLRSVTKKNKRAIETTYLQTCFMKLSIERDALLCNLNQISGQIVLINNILLHSWKNRSATKTLLCTSFQLPEQTKS